MDSFLEKLPVEAQEAISKVADEERKAREDLKARRARTAGEAIAETMRTLPFSMRLTGAERERLAAVAARLGMTKTDLARQLIIEGLERLESRQRTEVDSEKAKMVVGQIIDLLDRARIADPFRHRETGTSASL